LVDRLAGVELVGLNAIADQGGVTFFINFIGRGDGALSKQRDGVAELIVNDEFVLFLLCVF
jgi:hypothetical protein